MEIMGIRSLIYSVFNSYIATFTRAFLTLALVKIVSVFGGVGSLSVLGNVQNTLTIGASIASLSSQSGVSSRLASGADSEALKHAFHITIFGTCCLSLIITTYYVFFSTTGLSIPWPVFLLASVGLGVNTLVAAALIAHQKLAQLAFMYLVAGSVTLLWIFLSGSYNTVDFAYGICNGSWLGVLTGLAYLPKYIIDLKVRLILWPQYLGLVKYGFASLASVITLNSVALSARNSVLQGGDPLYGDLFEVGLRLNSLLDMFIIVPISAVMISSIAKAIASSGRNKIYFYGLIATAALSLSAGAFLYVFGDFVVSLLFSYDLIGVLDYLKFIMAIQFFRCLAAVALLKQLIEGNIFFTVLNSMIYLCAYFMFMEFLPYPPGSLTLVFTSMLYAVFAYTILPIIYLVRQK